MNPPPVTTAAFVNVAENAAATPIGIAAPTDPNGYSVSQLSATITAVPSDGAVLLNGAPVSVGETLTGPQLTSLDFLPTTGAFSQTSPLAYTVTDPSGASAEGTASLTIGPAAGGRVLTVGAGQEYATLAAAVAASQNGDTIEVQTGTYVNDFAQINTNITIEGVGGMVVLEATEDIPNGKAILVTDGNVTISNVEFTGATVSDSNGAGIRYETGDLILKNDYFYNNQEGILTDTIPSGNLLITNTEFDHNGDGSGSTHNIYVGAINSLTVDDSYFHDAVVGHEVKSRAANTYIYNSRIYDLSGSGSYSVDVPNGGNAILAGNVIQQGPNSQNPDLVAYGEEGSLYAGGSLQMYGNTLLNELTSHAPLGVSNATSATAQLANTQIYGITADQVAQGPLSQTGSTFLASEPSLNTSHPWLAMATASGFPLGALTSDGVSDLLMSDTNQLVVAELSEGALVYTQIGGLGPEWQFEGDGSFLGDGKTQFLIYDSISGSLVVGEDDNGAAQYTQIGGLGPEWEFVGNGALLGRSTDDFLIYDSNDGALVAGEVANGQAQYTQVGGLGAEWRFEGVGNFLNEGKAGFLIENSRNGTLVVGEYVNGSAQYTQVGGLGPEWQFEGNGDLLGHGQDDFLIWNNNTGSLVVGEVANGTAQYTLIGGVGPEWEFLGVGNYDGKSPGEFAMRDTDNGTLVLATINNGSASYASVGGVGPEWSFHTSDVAVLS